jgi:SprT protein
MSQVTRNQGILSKYIPGPAVPIISEWIYTFDFKLKIKKSRSTKYGDYRPPVDKLNHHISINHDLNPYAFLITLVHEIAHLSNWKKTKGRVKPHGEEWKQEFRLLMRPFFELGIFPADVHRALASYLINPAASSFLAAGVEAV